MPQEPVTTATATDHLRLLQVHWERPLPSDLAPQVDEVIASRDGGRLASLFGEAEEHAFL